jgi:hypothetical protein
LQNKKRRAPSEKKAHTCYCRILQTDYEELLKFWLADQVTAVVADEKELSNEVLNIAKKNINK